MGFLNRIFGNDDQQDQPRRSERSDDEIALERYRYLLRTAPPETIEQVHTEAFSKLTPEQRDLLFQQLSTDAPAGDAPKGPDAASLATSATRSELRRPGTMERSMGATGGMGGGAGGMGFGSMVGSSLLGTVAGYVIGSAIVGSFMGDFNGSDGADASDAGGDSVGDAGAGDSGADASADGGGYDGGGFDGGGFDGGGGFGGDFGGGDF